MLNFKFTKKLISSKELMADIGLSISWLDLKKSNWRKKGNDCWDMGLRIIGTKAFWDPIVFTKWLFEYECKNKPTNNTEQLENKALITFVKRNTKYEDQ